MGKSTLIRAIDPSLEVRVGEVSDAHHKGRHTTTFSEMYPLAEGGWLIDTPGIKGFGLIDLDGAEIARYFPNCSASHRAVPITTARIRTSPAARSKRRSREER